MDELLRRETGVKGFSLEKKIFLEEQHRRFHRGKGYKEKE